MENIEIKKTERGFTHLEQKNTRKYDQLRIQQSSAVGDYDHSLECPGSSFLWIGEAHVNKEDVGEIILYLKNWLMTGNFEPPKELDDERVQEGNQTRP